MLRESLVGWEIMKEIIVGNTKIPWIDKKHLYPISTTVSLQNGFHVMTRSSDCCLLYTEYTALGSVYVDCWHGNKQVFRSDSL